MKSNFDGKKYEIEVWNRKYTYENGIFPASIEINGEEILYSPITLNAKFGATYGKWQKNKIIPFSKTDENIKFVVAKEAENLIVNADITAEEDGFIRTDFRLMSYWGFSKDNMPRLTELSIDIPIKKEFASLMHFWPNCESAVCLSQKVLNSFSVPCEGYKLPFKPYVWIGTEKVGFGISCESDKGFLVDDKNSVYVIENKDSYVNLRINIMTKAPIDWHRPEDWGNALSVPAFSFGIQATPVKKFNHENLDNWRAFHLYGVHKFPLYEPVLGKGDTMLEMIAKSGANWLILHEEWSLIQNYGFIENEEQFKRFSADCHKLGLKLMVYFGYEVSSLMPGFNEKCGEMLNKNINGNYVGGWQREPVQRDYTVCYSGSYSDLMIERVKYVMDELGVDGIYTDGTYVPWECANEEHGCGYRNEKGELCYVYPIYAVREHVKKLYNAVHERGGIIDTHQSSCCLMATLSYADSYFDGENIQPMLQEDILKLKTDTFRAEFTGENMGIPCNFISYTNDEYTMRMIAGITLLHNVYPRANTMENLEFMTRLWKIYDSYGIKTAKWVPYWENSKFTFENENTYISYYERENDYLLIITTLDENVNSVSLKTDCTEITDYFDNDENCVIKNKTAQIPLSRINVKIVRMR